MCSLVSHIHGQWMLNSFIMRIVYAIFIPTSHAQYIAMYVHVFMNMKSRMLKYLLSLSFLAFSNVLHI